MNDSLKSALIVLGTALATNLAQYFGVTAPAQTQRATNAEGFFTAKDAYDACEVERKHLLGLVTGVPVDGE